MKKIILLFFLTGQFVLAQHTSILNDINAVTKDKESHSSRVCFGE